MPKLSPKHPHLPSKPISSLCESLHLLLALAHISKPSSYYAQLYRSHNLTGGHIIKLGPGNDEAAAEAVGAWPSGMQLGGGITDANALEWIEKGAEKVIVTSWLFPEGKFDLGRLKKLEGMVGRERLVVDIRWASHHHTHETMTMG